MGTLPDVELAGGTARSGRAAARLARIDRFREETRDDRIRIARDAERQFGRKVAWGARCGDEARIFTTLSVPVMTRLRMNERSILDTLVAGGVARSRSEALAWCVRLVGMDQGPSRRPCQSGRSPQQRTAELGQPRIRARVEQGMSAEGDGVLFRA